MSIQQVYAAIRVGRTPDAPQWDDLSKPMPELIEANFNLGILTATEYVGGNWSDTKTMATHLRWRQRRSQDVCRVNAPGRMGSKGKGPRESACQRGPS
jgi:hypothetical protein